MCKTTWDMEQDKPIGSVELIGSISLKKLKANMPNVYCLRKGERIPGTRAVLQADNFGIEFKYLNSNWHEVITFILENPAPDLSSYPNPYTGETMPQYTVVVEEPKESIFKKIRQTLKGWKKSILDLLGINKQVNQQ